jgi:hypothetical protein
MGAEEHPANKKPPQQQLVIDKNSLLFILF